MNRREVIKSLIALVGATAFDLFTSLPSFKPTVSQLLQATVTAGFDRQYALSEVAQIQNALTAHLIHRSSNTIVPLVWSVAENEGPKEAVIDLTAALLENAFETLDFLNEVRSGENA